MERSPIMRRYVAVTGCDVVLIQHTVRGWQAELLLMGVGAQCIASDPAAPHCLMVGTFNQGLFLSDDGGRSWRQAEQLPARRVLAVAVSPSWRVRGRGVIFAGAEPSALFRSEDSGQTWQEARTLRQLPSAPT